MVSFIGAHRAEPRIEPICAPLPITPLDILRTQGTQRRSQPVPPRIQRHQDLMALIAEIRRILDTTLRVFGVGKVRLQLGREQVSVARCTVEVLASVVGLQGALCGKPVGAIPDDVRRRPGLASSMKRSSLTCSPAVSSAGTWHRRSSRIRYTERLAEARIDPLRSYGHGLFQTPMTV